jgi:hypothetical protein
MKPALRLPNFRLVTMPVRVTGEALQRASMPCS